MLAPYSLGTSDAPRVFTLVRVRTLSSSPDRAAGTARCGFTRAGASGNAHLAARGALKVLRLTNTYTYTHTRKHAEPSRRTGVASSVASGARDRGDDDDYDGSSNDDAQFRSSGTSRSEIHAPGLTCTLTSLTTRTPYWTRLLAQKKRRKKHARAPSAAGGAHFALSRACRACVRAVA